MKYSTHSTYTNKNGVEVPSVTTILQILNKPALSHWANAMGFKRKKVSDILLRSSYIGTTVHNVIEAFFNGESYVYKENSFITKNELKLYLNQFFEWYKKHTVEVKRTETKYTSEKFGGTVDFYGIIDNKHTILDFKTSSNIYSSMFLQLAAYIYMMEEDGQVVEQAGIIMINKDKYREKIKPREFFDPYIEAFLTLVDYFHQWYDLNIKDGWGTIIDKK